MLIQLGSKTLERYKHFVRRNLWKTGLKWSVLDLNLHRCNITYTWGYLTTQQEQRTLPKNRSQTRVREYTQYRTPIHITQKQKNQLHETGASAAGQSEWWLWIIDRFTCDSLSLHTPRGAHSQHLWHRSCCPCFHDPPERGFSWCTNMAALVRSFYAMCPSKVVCFVLVFLSLQCSLGKDVPPEKM